MVHVEALEQETKKERTQSLWYMKFFLICPGRAFVLNVFIFIKSHVPMCIMFIMFTPVSLAGYGITVIIAFQGCSDGFLQGSEKFVTSQVEFSRLLLRIKRRVGRLQALYQD